MPTTTSLIHPPSTQTFLMRYAGPKLLLTFVATILAGCSETAPQIRIIEPLPHGQEPSIYLTAARHKNEVGRFLHAAGFQITDIQTDNTYLLRVTVGIDQGSRACGTLNNVRYALRKDNRDIIEATAKGWTGTCEPNVFDTVSRELRQRITEMTKDER